MTRSGTQAGLGQGRREQILPGDAPQHLALGPRRDAGGEQRRGRAVDRAVAAAGDLMQRAERQSASRQTPVDSLDSERQDDPAMGRRAGQALNALA